MERVHQRSGSREAFFRASTFGWLPSALQWRILKNEHDDEAEIVRKSRGMEQLQLSSLFLDLQPVLHNG